MSSDKGTAKANHSKGSIKDVAVAWHELYEILEEVKKSEHPGASYLLFFRELMMGSFVRLLELGLDVSAPFNPRVIPVSVARGPKTRAEGRRWEAEIDFHLKRYVSSFSAVGAGVHVVRSAVGDGALAEVSTHYVPELDALPASSPVLCLDDLASACMWWFLEPAVDMKASGADLEAACCDRMLHVFQLNPLMSAYRQVKDNKLPEAERLAAMSRAAGWSRANIRLWGNTGTRLRAALRVGFPDVVLEERLLELLPNAFWIAWQKREPTEALRSTGQGDENLVRRTAKILEDEGGQDSNQPECGVAELAAFAEREVVLKHAREVGLPPREQELFNLAMRDPGRFFRNGKLNHSEAARELGVAVGTTKSLWSRIRRTFNAA